MTREPDRYEAKGEELACAYHTARCPDRSTLAHQIAAALRAEHREALELAAQEVEAAKSSDRFAATQAILARRIRALASPAAAPEAGMVTCSTDTDEHHGVHRVRLGTRGDKSWCLDAVPVAPPSEPVAPSLLYRVLAALERWGASDEHLALAAELRRYIAEMEGKT